MRGHCRVMRRVCVLCLLVALCLPSAQPARAAATLHVTTCAATGAGSLPDIVANVAQTGDTVVFDLNCPAASPILLDDTLPIGVGLTIDATQPVPRTVVLDGVNARNGTVLEADGGAASIAVQLTGLTIRRGVGVGGGGLIVGLANVTLDRVAFTNNLSFVLGGAIYNTCSGVLTVTRGLFTGNQTGVNNAGGGAGGAIYNECAGTVHITDSVFTNNTAAIGGAVYSEGTLTVTGSTFSGNIAADVPGGQPGIGGAIANSGGTADIANSTFAGNQANIGGAVAVGNFGSGATTIVNATVGGNSASGQGGGISTDGDGLAIANTILAGNTAPTGANCAGAIVDNGYNLEYSPTTSCGLTPGAPKFDVLADPKLAPGPNENGGPTQTLAIGAGSAALGTGNPSICAGTAGPTPINGRDQRGKPRPATTCDIGAVEAQVAGYSLTMQTTAGAGVALSPTLTATSEFGGALANYLGTAHFTSSDPLATLPPDYPFVAGDNGAHTFTGGLTLRTLGGQTVTATDTATGTVTGGVSLFVTPASGAGFTATGFPTTTSAGTAGSLTVIARDASGNVATGYTGTVQFTSNDPQATLPAPYTFTNSDQGIHTFSATLKTVGTRSITVTDSVTGTITGTQGGIAVSPGVATRYALSGTPATQQASTPFNVTVTVKDAFGNTATNYTGSVRLTATDVAATLPTPYAFVPADNGLRSLPITLNTAGAQTITASDLGTPAITGTASVTITGPGVVPVNPAPSGRVLSTALSPRSGPASGATITITGTGLAGASVTVGGAACTQLVVSPAGTSVTCTAPPHAPGTVDVVLTTGSGTITIPSGFTYLPPSGVPPAPAGRGVGGAGTTGGSTPPPAPPKR